MSELTVCGGRPLYGEITVSGSKNAALPILFSTMITRGVSRISRIPDISDVDVAIELLRGFGALIMREGDTLYVDTRKLFYRAPDNSLISKIRASTYLLGASLARFGKCVVSDFGGCNFTKRPIDLHIRACLAFGGRECGRELLSDKLSPALLSFPKRSVGATANALILAASVEGESKIRGFAKEPHIINLINFLRSAGARIDMDDDEITVCGGELHGGSVELIGDMIEAGSYLAAGIATEGRVGVRGCNLREMAAFLDFLSLIGIRIGIESGVIFAERENELFSAAVTAEPYPSFPTDLQPIAAAVMSVVCGGEIYDRVFPERFGYLEELSRMGVSYVRGNGFAIIKKSALQPAVLSLPDLRGGMACLICALATDGKSIIRHPEILFRGYDGLERKLCAVGADIKFN